MPPETPAVDPWAPFTVPWVTELTLRLAKAGVVVTEAQVRLALGPPPEGKGDLALPVFRWAKAAGKAPPALASALAAGPLPGAASVEAAGGFVNLTVDGATLTRLTLGSIFGRAGEYGHLLPRTTKVCLEHTSANPTGPLHVGRSRNSVIGDTYARVLRAAGFPVTVHFYVDDVGRQAATLVWIWSKPVGDWPPDILDKAQVGDGTRPSDVKSDAWRGRPYVAANDYLKAHEEAAAEVVALAASLTEGKIDPETYRQIPREVTEGICVTLGRMGIGFDEFVWESSFILDGSVKDVLRRLATAPGATRLENGALAVDGTAEGLPKEEPYVMAARGDGSDLYPARDAAYHERKFRDFDRVVNVLGEDHKLHARGLQAILTALGHDKRPEVVFYSFINLPEGRMTTRGGRVVVLDALLNEAVTRARDEVVKRRQDLTEAEVTEIAEKVGAGATRFHILRIQPEKPITFVWEEALSFEGKSAPFVQYAHARAASILRKAAETEPELARTYLQAWEGAVPPMLDPAEGALVRVLARLPALVEQVANDHAVHLMALYAHEVAEKFNQFYQADRVLNAEPAVRPFRLALVAATRQVLHNVLDLIGVAALDRM